MVIVQLHGGLGNQLFQYACGKAVSYRMKTKLVLDTFHLKWLIPSFTPRDYGLDAFLIKSSLLEDIPFQQLPDAFTIVAESGTLTYNPDFTQWAGKHIYLKGCWQSWKYFQHIQVLLRKCLRFTKQGFSASVLQLDSKLKQQNAISLHVRRTDYTEPQNAYINVLPIGYYENAIRYISTHQTSCVFYVFSDDPAWAEENINVPFEVHFMRGNSSIEDLYLMSQCRHHIIANSTFSWWGAWLNANPDKTVITPDTWFPGSNLKVRDVDLIPPGWIPLNIYS